MTVPLTISEVLGAAGPATAASMRAGLAFLEAHDTEELLLQVGSTVDAVPPAPTVSKAPLPRSYGGGREGPTDDFLVGRGLFYITEQGRLFLDCTAGHYQMTWGYGHPDLCAAVEEAMRAGVVWDNHTNIPQAPLKALARELLDAANAPGEEDPLDTALLGVCTGSVACGAALKTMLAVHAERRPAGGRPVVIALDGNYHGTDVAAQHLRGMWPGLVTGFDVEPVQPNDLEGLEQAFRTHGRRVAGFWAEPVMMNREAIPVEAGFLHAARQWCDEVGALLCIDEIQTGFWQPELLASRALALRPDLVVVGKGMTAGFHPLAGLLLRRRHDVLAQYDAISTNGSAALPAFVALCSIALIRQAADDIRQAAARIEAGMAGLVERHPGAVERATGRGHLAGVRFRTVEGACATHAALLRRGLWTRVHAYHGGHRTLLTKLALPAGPQVVDFLAGCLDACLDDLERGDVEG